MFTLLVSWPCLVTLPPPYVQEAMRRKIHSLFAEVVPNQSKSLGLFDSDTAPETQEHLEGRLTASVEELKTEPLFAIEMDGLFHGEVHP
jgi:hypothetical protein